MSGVTSSYSNVATIPEIQVLEEVVLSSTGAYTCPTGKKAKIVPDASMNLESIGADATYALAIKKGAVYTALGDFVVALKTSRGAGMLQAGDILTLIGDSGSTNGDGHISAIIQEISV